MMRRAFNWLALLLVTLAAVPVARAAQPKQPPTPQTIPTEAVTAPTPSVMSQEGVIAGRYPYGTPQRLLLVGADGKEFMLLVDPTKSSIMKDHKPVTLTELQDGAQVKVSYTEQHGERWLQSLESVPTSALPPASASVARPATPASHPTATPSAAPASSSQASSAQPAASPAELQDGAQGKVSYPEQHGERWLQSLESVPTSALPPASASVAHPATPASPPALSPSTTTAAPSAASVSSAASPTPPAPAPLEGTSWSVKVTPDAIAAQKGEKPFDDTLIFKDGKVTMSACVKLGFAASAYSLTHTGEAWSFATRQVSQAQGMTRWAAMFTGETVKGTLLWMKPDGTSLRYTFQGKQAAPPGAS